MSRLEPAKSGGSTESSQPVSPRFDTAPAESTVSFLPVHPENAEASAAAQYLLQANLEDVESAPLEQLALARNYLSWRKRMGQSNGNEKRLAGRIELAIQGRHRASAPGAGAGRRQEFVLRAAVDKIISERIDTMTFRELELIVSSYAVLVQRPERSSSEERLIWILNKAVSELERLLADLPVQSERAAAPTSAQ